MHTGIHIGGDTGTPVIAAAPGKVASSGSQPEGGIYYLMDQKRVNLNAFAIEAADDLDAVRHTNNQQIIENHLEGLLDSHTPLHAGSWRMAKGCLASPISRVAPSMKCSFWANNGTIENTAPSSVVERKAGISVCTRSTRSSRVKYYCRSSLPI
jgi:hypothetical protein